MQAIEEHPEFVAIHGRILREGPTKELVAKAQEIVARLEDQQREEERVVGVQQMQKLSTNDKIALGLAQSKAARGARSRGSGGMMDEPGPTKPAA